MIQRERLQNLLIELVQIDSISGKEGTIAQRLKREMEELGCRVRFDDAGGKVGGQVGNVIVHFDGNVREAKPILLSAHMDTVVPGEGVVPVLDGHVLRSDGRTVLGGDDKSGVAIICEVLRVLRENDLPCSDIDVVFTICEEFGLLGAKYLEPSELRASSGMVLDSDSVGFLFINSPVANHIEFTIRGLESHAGICPEWGISAIQVAADGISRMQLGRIDDETTANLGMIEGGMAVNIVPNQGVLKGETRSHSEEKLEKQTQSMLRCLEDAAAAFGLEVDGKPYWPTVKASIERQYDTMDLSYESPIVRLVQSAAARMGLQVQVMATGGGCDANIFNKKGLEVANLSTGMREIHTVNEWLDLNDFYTSAEIVLEVVRLNSAPQWEKTLRD